jgi:hypothetical protein
MHSVLSPVGGKSPNRFGRHRPRYAARVRETKQFVAPVVIACAACAAGCGSAATISSAARSTPTSVSAAHRRPARISSRPAQPSVGVTQRVRAGGSTLSVAAVRVIDPLRDSGAALLTGTRAVGVLIRIRNDGPGTYDSSATGDVSIVPSTGTTTPVFAARGVCQTPLRDFDNDIGTGEVRTGCVAFAIESGAKLLGVRFSPHGQTAGRVAWRASS